MVMDNSVRRFGIKITSLMDFGEVGTERGNCNLKRPGKTESSTAHKRIGSRMARRILKAFG
jgi:hypothetical protein